MGIAGRLREATNWRFQSRRYGSSRSVTTIANKAAILASTSAAAAWLEENGGGESAADDGGEDDPGGECGKHDTECYHVVRGAIHIVPGRCCTAGLKVRTPPACNRARVSG
jgi:hypothetical protein